MSLNIKNQETVDLARELAKVTGETVTAAVTEAVRERLERLRRERRDQGLVARLLAIAADTAPRFKGPDRLVDHADLLYDEMGLPK